MHFSLILVGAHDGSKSEQAVRCACERGHVLLIEPVRWLFDRLQDRFRNLANIQLCNCAISTRDGEADFYAPLQSANEVAPWGDQLGSFNPTHAQEHDPRFIGKIAVERVRTMTFASLIKRHGISAIDLLMTDTEGYDAKLLSGFPFELLRPHRILFEFKHSDGVFHIGKSFARIVTVLDSLNYNIRIADEENCMATLKV
ncbi:MAG: FkbM family methyltransferase [Reyranellaceae bacterium]